MGRRSKRNRIDAAVDDGATAPLTNGDTKSYGLFEEAPTRKNETKTQHPPKIPIYELVRDADWQRMRRLCSTVTRPRVIECS